MATQEFSAIQTVNSLVKQANEAIAAGNWGEAEVLVIRARVLLGAIPDSEAVNNKLEFDREALGNVLADIRQARPAAETAKHGLRRTDINYQRVRS